MPGLSQSPIDPVETERSAQELLNAFFKSYFDGQPHDTSAGTGDEAITFPKCNLAFNAASVPPVDKPLIHTVFADLRPARTRETIEAVQYTVETLLNIFVRVRNAGGQGEKNDFDCRRVADLVRFLFNSPAERRALNEKNILRARVERGPVPQPFPGWQARLLVVSAQLRYAIALP